MPWEFSFPSVLGDVPDFVDQIISEIEKEVSLNEGDLFALKISLEESLINAVKHGNHLNKDKKVKVSGRFIKQEEVLEVEVEDQGRGYSADKLPDPVSAQNLYKLSGRGVYIIKRFMDKVEFLSGGRKIRMIKYLKKEGG